MDKVKSVAAGCPVSQDHIPLIVLENQVQVEILLFTI